MQVGHCVLAAGLVCVAAAAGNGAEEPWLVYEGKSGPGQGKHVVLISGDDEYRSEEGMPMLGRILAERHGFKCTVLFAIDPQDGTIKPDYQRNIPGTHLLADADLLILFTRFRQLPDEQMKPIIDYVNSGRPIIGLRTATHAFNYDKDSTSIYARYSWTSDDPPGGFGQMVFGDTWVSHHGKHGQQSTRGVINPAFEDHPILRGVKDIWGPSDVYGIVHLPETAQVLVFGQVLDGMQPNSPPDPAKNDPMMPLAWITEYRSPSGETSPVFCTTMGASQDLASEDLRRLLVNACYWGVGMAERIPASADVRYVGTYDPTPFGFGKYRPGKKPQDLR